MHVRELMKRPLIVERDISLGEAAQIMSDKNIGSLIFVLNNAIKGIVTERDLIKNFGKHEKISHIMSKNVITINPDEALDSTLELMRNKKVKRLPVVNKEKLVGIITLTDIMANFENLEGDFFFE